MDAYLFDQSWGSNYFSLKNLTDDSYCCNYYGFVEQSYAQAVEVEG